MKKKNLKKLIILNIPYIVIGLVATNIGEAFRRNVVHQYIFDSVHLII